MKIRVIDMEMTGFEPPAKVVEIAAVDFCTDSMSIAAMKSTLINPQIPIPPETSAVHHIIDEDVQGFPTWEEVYPEYLNDDNIDAFCAHSIKCERQWCTDDLTGGKPWICTYKGAMRLWPDAPAFNNGALRYWRNPKNLIRSMASPAHRALPDAYVTAWLLRDMLEVTTPQQLIEWAELPVLQQTCRIGKFRNVPWREVDSGFLYWCRDKDFDEDVLYTVEHEIARREQDQRDNDPQDSLL